MIRRTWFWEQVVFTACLALAVYGNVQHATDTRQIAIAVLGAAAAFAAQKVRSGADRQREQNELHSVSQAHLACTDRIGRWAFVGQGLSIVALGSQTPLAIPVAAFALLYPMWRFAYRIVRPIASDGGVPDDDSDEIVQLLWEQRCGDETEVQTMKRLIRDARNWRSL